MEPTDSNNVVEPKKRGRPFSTSTLSFKLPMLRIPEDLYNFLTQEADRRNTNISHAARLILLEVMKGEYKRGKGN
jgi:hypothetical protein